MDKTLLPIRLTFVALCAAGGWLVCYTITDWDSHRGVALAVGASLGIYLGQPIGSTLRGVSREVVLDVTLNALKRHPLPPFRRTAGFSATTTLSRADFGISAWPSVIGDKVELRIEAEAVRDAAAEAPPATTEPTPEPDTSLEDAADAALKSATETEDHP